MKIEWLNSAGRVVHTAFAFGIKDAGLVIAEEGARFAPAFSPIHITIKEIKT